MRPDYVECYRDLYDRHWWWRSREAAILDTIRARQPLARARRILDVGCGDGLFFEKLAEFGEVEGIEPAGELVSDDSPYRSRIYIRPFDRCFQPGKLYSLILMLDVLEHLADPVAALDHALTLLEPEGALLITVPAFRLVWTNHDVLNHHLTRYTAGSFRRVAERAELEIDKEMYLFQWLFTVKLATRLAERLLRPEPKPPKVPARWLNTVLFWLCRFEFKALSPLPVPFGSSLLVLGHQRKKAGDSVGNKAGW